MILSLRLLLASLLAPAATTALSAAVSTGTFTFVNPHSDDHVVVFFAKSTNYNPAHPPVMVFHGMLRNPWDYRDGWIELADAFNLFVVVPYFRHREFSGTVGYNLGNVFASESDLTRQPESAWSYRLPDAVFDYMQSAKLTAASGYFAFGHSAGSQFLHRKQCFAPDPNLRLAVCANAGWYTFPFLDVPWPYGYMDTGVSNADLIRFFEAPIVILLGDQDTDPLDSSLRRAPEAMAQGPHRFARGQAFFNAARDQAAALGVPFRWILESVPGVGHEGARMAPAAARIMQRELQRMLPNPADD